MPLNMFPVVKSDVSVRRFRHSGLILDCWYPIRSTGAILPEQSPTCPVIIFEHGYQGNAKQNSHQIRFLASQGYILFAVNHPGESLFTAGKPSIFPGRCLNTLNIAGFSARRRETRRVYENFRQSRNSREVLNAMRDFSKLDYLAPAHNAISARMERVLSLPDFLQELNRSGDMEGRMDLGNVGIYGYSMGGNVSCLLAARDSLPVKLGAAANLDGVQLVRTGEALPQIGVPFMMVYGTGVMIGNLMMNLEGANDWISGRQAGWRVVFRGARHANFSDFGRLAFLRGIVNGRLDGRRMADALNLLLLCWFDWHLKGKTVDMNEMVNLYPSWEISAFPVH